MFARISCLDGVLQAKTSTRTTKLQEEPIIEEFEFNAPKMAPSVA